MFIPIRSGVLFSPVNYCSPSEYMQKRISFLHENKTGLLKSLKSQVEYLISLLKNCGPLDEGYFSVDEMLELCVNHNSMIIFYGGIDVENHNSRGRSQSVAN